MAPFKAHIPLCGGNGKDTLTVDLSVEEPPTSVRVPLDPTDATKFHDLPVDPSIWEELNTELTKYLDLSRQRELRKSDFEYRQASKAALSVTCHPVMDLHAALRVNETRERWEAAETAYTKQLVAITGVIYKSIDSWVGYPASKDVTGRIMAERIESAFKSQSGTGALQSREPKHLLATNYAVFAECASCAWALHREAREHASHVQDDQTVYNKIDDDRLLESEDEGLDCDQLKGSPASDGSETDTK